MIPIVAVFLALSYVHIFLTICVKKPLFFHPQFLLIPSIFLLPLPFVLVVSSLVSLRRATVSSSNKRAGILLSGICVCLTVQVHTNSPAWAFIFL